MMTARERYLNDQTFRALVDALEVQISLANYTLSELRQAVILATIHYEQKVSHTERK